MTFSLLFITLALCQTDFKNTCQSKSLLPLLATGSISMDLFDSSNNGANKVAYQDLSFNKFQKTEVLGYAFALTGFEGPCGQSYYTLAVDKVQFENDNSRMRIVVNYRTNNPGITPILTTWTRVTFTYIIVSRNFNGAYSDIWATVAEAQGLQIANANTGISASVPIDSYGLAFSAAAPPTTCSAYSDPNFNYAPLVDSCYTNSLSNPPTNSVGGRLLIHAYIMGFGWDSSRSTNRFLAVSVFNKNYPIYDGASTAGTFPEFT